MREYWLRTAIVTIAFLDLCVTGIAALSHPTLIHIAWASYFIILAGLIVSHRKKNMHKAFLNFIVLLMIAIPVSGLCIPIAWIARGLEFSAIRDNFYIFLSLVALIYLAIRHEKMSIPEAASKVAVYVGEIRTDRLRSSFGRYILGETIVFLTTFVLGSYYLLK
jgi:hypothetical protein